MDPGKLIRDARSNAGLSQRELARRASTSQPVISRIERGLTSPTMETLTRLLHATGHELRTALTPRATPDSHMLQDISRILSLSPEDRLIEIRNLSRFQAAAVRHA